MTLDYYTSELRTLVKQYYDDTELDDRLLVRWINSQRGLWIKNQVNNEYVVSENVLQTIKCLHLVIKDGKDCGFGNSPTRYLVSEEKIPKLLEFKDRLGIIDLRFPSLDGYSMNYVPKKDLKYSGNGRFNQSDVYYTIHNSKIYIRLDDLNFKLVLLTNATFEGIFENPIELSRFTNCEGDTCFNIDTDDYPINDALWEYMQEKIVSNKLGIFLNAPENKENDNSSKT